MKKLRKNIDLDHKIVLVLQMEATTHGYGTLKPFLESILVERAEKAVKANPAFYAQIDQAKKPKAKTGNRSRNVLQLSKVR